MPDLERDEEIVRLLALQVRLAMPNQTAAIVELGRAGFGPARIGELLGTSTATAKTTLHRARKKDGNSND